VSEIERGEMDWIVGVADGGGRVMELSLYVARKDG